MPSPAISETSVINQANIESGAQFGRKIDLVVFGTDLNGFNLSSLRIKFSVKRSDTMTPNVADIRVYNLALNTALQIKNEFSPILGDLSTQTRGKVILQAGYESNFGVIFQGNIKQVIVGRESATDTFVDIIAGDGDRAYNFAIVNTTLAAGATQENQVEAAVGAMATKGVTEGHVGDFPSEELPRGKVMYGNARNYLRDAAQTTDKTWSIQDEKVTFVSNTSYLPGERVKINAKTGMIGMPQGTNVGINVKCLLNPRIKVGGLIEVDNKSVQEYKVNLEQANSSANIPPPLTDDGVYYVSVIEQSGDTRGVDWYSNLICFTQNPTSNPLNSVKV